MLRHLFVAFGLTIFAGNAIAFVPLGTLSPEEQRQQQEQKAWTDGCSKRIGAINEQRLRKGFYDEVSGFDCGYISGAGKTNAQREEMLARLLTERDRPSRALFMSNPAERTAHRDRMCDNGFAYHSRVLQKLQAQRIAAGERRDMGSACAVLRLEIEELVLAKKLLPEACNKGEKADRFIKVVDNDLASYRKVQRQHCR